MIRKFGCIQAHTAEYSQTHLAVTEPKSITGFLLLSSSCTGNSSVNGRNTCQPNKHLLKDHWYTSNIYICMTGWTASFRFFFSSSASLSTNCVHSLPCCINFRIARNFRRPSAIYVYNSQSRAVCYYTLESYCLLSLSPFLIAFSFRIIEFVSSFNLSLFLIIFLTLVQNRLDNLLLCKSNSMDAFLSYVHCFLVPGRGLCSSAPPRRL